MSDLVSVIIPTYGGGEFLKPTIDSVLGQTHKEIEVIVVDDNGLGTENQIKTQKELEIYKDDERVRYVCHEVNINGSAARNTGFRNSKGAYIALLDDDDIYYPENIERQLAVLKTLPDDYGYTYCSRDEYQNGVKVKEIINTLSGNCFYEIMMHKVAIGSCAFLMRREVFEEVGGFDESFKRHQDWEFVAKVAFKYKVQAVDYIGFRKNIVMRTRHTKPETAKEYREHYLEKMSPYIDQLEKKKQDDIRIYNRLSVAFEFYKLKGMKAFIREYRSIKPGIRGVLFIVRKTTSVIKRKVKG